MRVKNGAGQVKPAIQHCSGFQSLSPSHITSDIPFASEVFQGSASWTYKQLLISSLFLTFHPEQDVGFQNKRSLLLWPLTVQSHRLCSPPAPALALVRKLQNQEAATTASGSSVTLVWRGSRAQFAEFYHRHSSSGGHLTQPVMIWKRFPKEQMLEKNNPRIKGRMRFFFFFLFWHRKKTWLKSGWDESMMPLGDQRMRAVQRRVTVGTDRKWFWTKRG